MCPTHPLHSPQRPRLLPASPRRPRTAAPAPPNLSSPPAPRPSFAGPFRGPPRAYPLASSANTSSSPTDQLLYEPARSELVTGVTVKAGSQVVYD